MINKKNTKFICPKCGDEFTYEELFSHNEELFLKIIEDFAKEMLKEKELVLKNEYLKNVQLREMEIEKKFSTEKTELIANNKVLENKLQEAYNYNSQQIEQLKMLHSKELEANKQQLVNDFNKEHSTKINEKIREKQELELINENLRKEILSIKESVEKESKAKIALIEKDAKLKEKESLEEMSKKLTLVERQNEQLQNILKQKETEKENLVNKMELETKVRLNEERKKYEDRINQLEITNAQNRLINSKVKGENFENEAEGELRKAFGISDSIEKITTGDKKADYRLIVKNHENQEMGRIIYELKNAKWSDAWEKKLVEDMAKEGGKYGILVATSFNEKYKEVPFIRSTEYKNVWITDHLSFVFVGQILRKLVEVEFEFEKRAGALTAEQNNELLTKYENVVNKLKVFMMSNLPVIVTKLKKQYADLEKVSKSLISNSQTVNKSLDIIKKQIENEIIKEMESISDISFQFDEAEVAMNDSLE